MRLPSRRFATAVLVLALSGCGDAEVTRGEPSSPSYTGPLYLTRDAAEQPDAGAAGQVVECDTWGGGGFNDVDVYSEGATADSPEEALEVARGEGGFEGASELLRVAKEEQDRALFVLEVGGVVKQAVVVRDGPATEGAGGPGWYVESWARCDYAELPRSYTDSLGLQIWNDSSGRPAPTTKIEAWLGPEHCGWESMTFLHLGEAEYVRAPLPELADYFSGPYDDHAELPGDAVDTGYERDGEHLWLSSDSSRAFVGTKEDVEVWPRTVQPLGCD